VLIAHREHASVDAPLPTLNGQVPSKGELAASDAPPPRAGDGEGRRRTKRNAKGNDRRKRKS
jgi:hypothetical protein